MKSVLVYILALLVMGGSFVPCCADNSCREHVVRHNEPAHKKEACSPFFACASCAGFVQMAKYVSLPQPVVERPVHHEKISPFFVSIYYSSFFKPPRTC